MDDALETTSSSSLGQRTTSVSDQRIANSVNQVSNMPPCSCEVPVLLKSFDEQVPCDENLKEGCKSVRSPLKEPTKSKLRRTRGKSAFSKYVANPAVKAGNVCCNRHGQINIHLDQSEMDAHSLEMAKMVREMDPVLKNEKKVTSIEEVDDEVERSWKLVTIRPDKPETTHNALAPRKRLLKSGKAVSLGRHQYSCKHYDVNCNLQDELLFKTVELERPKIEQPHMTVRYQSGHIAEGHPSIIDLADFLRSEQKMELHGSKVPMLSVNKKHLFRKHWKACNSADIQQMRLPSRMRHVHSPNKRKSTLSNRGVCQVVQDQTCAISVVPMYVNEMPDRLIPSSYPPCHGLNPNPEPAHSPLALVTDIGQYPSDQQTRNSDRVANALLSPRWNSYSHVRQHSNTRIAIKYPSNHQLNMKEKLSVSAAICWLKGGIESWIPTVACST